ncbi:bucky ball [Amia ocellicauda]|uniref:bucky ball n=1 Tax=Amia ocellicauda TaxID=2972642 RepID=UPI00346449B1
MATTQHPVGNGQHPEDHTRPFFYVQPSPPYYPYQWQMPMHYNPYCAFPGLGYGMGYPPLPPNPYMEVPGYIVPQAQLHPADYRRLLNPNFPAAMAYHARRFRYQQNTTSRETTSSEVQTEPAVASSDSKHLGIPDLYVGTGPQVGSDSGRESIYAASSSNSGTCSHSERNVGKEGDGSSGVSRVTTPKSFIFQKEEVRIECTDMPSSLKFYRSRETTAESAQSASGDLVQCDVWSMSSTEGVIPLYSSTVHENSVLQNVAHSGDLEEQCVPGFPDILLIGSLTAEDIPAASAETSVPHKECETKLQKAVPPATTEQDVGALLNKLAVDKGMKMNADNREDGDVNPEMNVHFKILKLPFEVQSHEDELRKGDESKWSVETLVPYVPSAERLVQQDLKDPEKTSEELTMEGVQDNDAKQTDTSARESSQDQSTRKDKTQEESLWSVESLPPYVPSASWLADFGNVYYLSKLPQSVQQQLHIFSPSPDEPKLRKKRSLKSEHPDAVPGTAIVHTEAKRSHRRMEVKVSNNEGLCNHLSNRKVLGPKNDGEKNCTRCISKQNLCLSPNAPNVASKRHKLTAQTSPKLTCTACKCSLEKAMIGKGLGSEVQDTNTEEEEDMEEETMEDKGILGVLKESCELKMTSTSKKRVPPMKALENCSIAHCPNFKEMRSGEDAKHGFCHDDGNGRSHPDLVKGLYEENMTTSVPDKCTGQEHRCFPKKPQTEKAWRESMVISDKESWENYGAKPKCVNKPKKVYPLTQEKQYMKKVSSKPNAQRPKRNECDEPLEADHLRPNKTRGSSSRRGTRH